VSTPRFIKPCLPSTAREISVGPAWGYEIKHDGYRFIVAKVGDEVQVFSRNGKVWSKSVPTIIAARGRASEAFLYAFDLLELDGEDLRKLPWEERREQLVRLLRKPPPGIQLSEHTEGDGEALFRHACAMGLEGIVAKRRQSRYRSGPSKVWVKVKNPASPAYTRVRDAIESKIEKAKAAAERAAR
jgi:bifunctional non-homologous end joining protein LigD